MNKESGGQSSVPTSVFWLFALWILVLLVSLVWGVGNAESKLRESTRTALADGGYDIAVDCARDHGLNLPGILP